MGSWELGKKVIIDLTHPIGDRMPHWPGDPPTKLHNCAEVAQHGFYLNSLTIGEHSGTHIGAPRHFIESARDISQARPETLIVPAIKISIVEPCRNDSDYLLTVSDLIRWESQFGAIPLHHLVLIETGWSRFWGDSDVYLGTDGQDQQMHFPGVSDEAVIWLCEKKQIVGLGIDTAGVDGGQSTDYRANQVLAGQGCYHLENLTNLEKVCQNGAIVFIGALPIENGSGSPCRVLALQDVE